MRPAKRRVIPICRQHADGTQKTATPEDFPENVYITFDLDGLDPSVTPSIRRCPAVWALSGLDLVEGTGHNAKKALMWWNWPRFRLASDFTAALIAII